MLFFFYLAIARTIQVSFLTPHTYHYIIPQTQLSGLEWDDLAEGNNERKRKKGIKLKGKKGRMTRESKSHGGKRRGKGKRKKGQRGFLSSVEDLRVLHFHHLHLCHHLHYLPHHDHPLQWRGCWWLSCTLKIMGSIQRIDSQDDIVWRYLHVEKSYWNEIKCVGKDCFSAFKQGINHATYMSFDRDTDQSLKGMHVNSFVAGTFAIHSSTLYALLWPSAQLQPF